MTTKFWENKKLEEFSTEEWEKICTHCGRCCLIKLQDEDSDDIYYTNVLCRYFDSKTHQCTEYQNRCQLVPECLKLTPQNVDGISWMPQGCAYRHLFELGHLPDWHPLVSGEKLPLERSIPQNCVSELLVNEEDLEDHIIEDEDDL